MGLLKRVFTAMAFFGCNILSVNQLKYVSMNNQECRARPEVININSNKYLFYLYSIKMNKCGGSCNDINDPYANLCVPAVVKGIKMSKYLILC